MATDKHLSGSAIQKGAEAEIVEAAARALQVPLRRDPEFTRIAIGGTAHIEVDAISFDGTVVVEAYARRGALKGAQLKKVAQDVLKLALLDQLAATSIGASSSLRAWRQRTRWEVGFGSRLTTSE